MPSHGKSIFLMAALLMGVSFQACAQVGCPPGYYPIGGANAGWHDCAPAGNSAAPPEPGPSWLLSGAPSLLERVGTASLSVQPANLGPNVRPCVSARLRGARNAKFCLSFTISAAHWRGETPETLHFEPLAQQMQKLALLVNMQSMPQTAGFSIPGVVARG